MSNPLSAYLALLVVHWVADFVWQTHWQASNKSQRIDALSRHVASYTAGITIWALYVLGWKGLLFGLINGVLHFATDFCTSRWSASIFRKTRDYYATDAEKAAAWHNFFVVIGLDQLIHQVTLAFALAAFIGD